jgi:hypothetical protein
MYVSRKYMFRSLSALDSSFHEAEPVGPLGSFSRMLFAVLIAVIMMTGTDPIIPAKKRYLKTGKKNLTNRFTAQL